MTNQVQATFAHKGRIVTKTFPTVEHAKFRLQMLEMDALRTMQRPKHYQYGLSKIRAEVNALRAAVTA